jgi:hypothetical protein
MNWQQAHEAYYQHEVLEVVFDNDFQYYRDEPDKIAGINCTIVGTTIRAFHPLSQFLHPYRFYPERLPGLHTQVRIIECDSCRRQLKVSQKEAYILQCRQFIDATTRGELISATAGPAFADGSFQAHLSNGAITVIPARRDPADTIQACPPTPGTQVSLLVEHLENRGSNFWLSYREPLLTALLKQFENGYSWVGGRLESITEQSVGVRVGQLMIDIPMRRVTDDPATLDLRIEQQIPLELTAGRHKGSLPEFGIKGAVLEQALAKARRDDPLPAKIVAVKPDGSLQLQVSACGIKVFATLARNGISNSHKCKLGATIGIIYCGNRWQGYGGYELRQTLKDPVAL